MERAVPIREPQVHPRGQSSRNSFQSIQLHAFDAPSCKSPIIAYLRNTPSRNSLVIIYLCNLGGRGWSHIVYLRRRAFCVPDGLAGAPAMAMFASKRTALSGIALPCRISSFEFRVSLFAPFPPVTSRAQRAPGSERPAALGATLQMNLASTDIGLMLLPADPNPAARHSQRARRKRIGPRKTKE